MLGIQYRVGPDTYPIPNSLRSKEFEIQVRAHEDHFQILINNEQFCTYKYMLPLASITHFTVHTDVGYDDLRQFSVQLGANEQPIPSESGITTTGFSFCKTLYITGLILPHIDRPQINFLRKNETRPLLTQSALHMLLRYDHGKLLMDAAPNGQWGTQQAEKLPFERGVPFNLTITNELRGFEILANGKHHSFFAHRICPFDITTIWIVEIADLKVEVSHAANCELPKEDPGICANSLWFPGQRNSAPAKANKCEGKSNCGGEKPKLNYLLPLPYIHKLKKPIEPGQTFIVKGESTPKSQHWSINFHAKTNGFFKDYYGNHNVALNIAVIYANKVYVHSYINNNWVGDDTYPIPNSLRNTAFEIQVRTHQDHFQVLINNEQFCTYKYRLPLASITHFSVHSDVGYDDLRQFSVQLGTNELPIPTESGITTTGFSFCKTLYITGMILPHIQRPQINLLRNNEARPLYTQTALHFLPCYDVGKLWLNDFQNGQWGVHQVENLPFERGVPFNLTITNELRGFEILANGKHHSFFAHRICPFDITTIWIVEIADLTVEVSHASNCEVSKEKTGICGST